MVAITKSPKGRFFGRIKNMKNIETPDKMHLGKLIGQLEDGRFVIPNFQREFVWSPADVKELLKSIFEDYYIGTFLLWKASSDNVKSLSCEPIYGYKDKVDPEHIVLDGQQRLSALYYSFFAPNIKYPYRKSRCLFFINLENLLNDDYENAINYDWLYRRVEIVLESREIQYKEKIFPLNILGQKPKELYKWLEGYEDYWSGIVGNKKSSEERQKIEKTLDELLDNYDISYIELDRNIEVSKVCDIFTKINSTGEKLDIFDLLNALLVPKDIFLKKMWREASKNMEDVDPVYLLQTMSVLKQDYCAPKFLYYLVPDAPKSIKKSDGTLEKIKLISSKEEFIKLWDHVVDKSAETIKKWTNHRDFGAIQQRFIPYPTMLPILTALNIEKEEGNYKDKSGIDKKTRRWYWSSIFTQNYSSSVESQITSDYIEMKKWFADDSQIPQVVNQMDIDIKNLDLEGETSSGSAIYKAIFDILILKGARDFNSSDLPEYLTLQDHHIVPQIWGRKMKLYKRIDTILNRTPLSDKTNRDVIGKKLPNEYLQEMFKKTENKEDVFKVLESHFVSKKAVDILMRKDFSVDDYDEFIEERKKVILEEIRSLLDLEEKNPSGLINPDAPFSNKRQIERVIKNCDNYIFWVDKYFSKFGLEIIADGLTFNDNKVNDIRILTSDDKATEELRDIFKDFRKEMKNKGVNVEMKVIASKKDKSDIHDRWILTDGKTYNIPSPDVIARGQYSEIKNTSADVPFNQWWNNALDVISDWDKIINIKKS